MAETPDSDKLVKKEPEGPQPDPITRRSTSSILLVSSLLMMGVLAWALYDEAYSQRPWKGIQREFVARYERYLKSIRTRSRNSEKEVKESPEYQQLDADAKAARAQVDPRLKEIDKEVASIQDQINAITDPYQDARGRITVITYNAEVAGSPAKKQKYLKQVEQKKQETIKVQMPVDGTGKTTTQNFNYVSLENKYNELRDRKAALLTEKGELLKEPTELAKKRDDYLKNQMMGLREDQVKGLIAKAEHFDYSMRQINVLEYNIVDRCETCHLGVREPLTLLPTNMRPGRGKKPDSLSRAFVSHPSKELLDIHNPDKFGCSSCHWGNGRATTSTEKGHGQNPFWLHPLFEKENMQAGCQQCHAGDRVTQGADTLNLGRDLFQQRGCVGCHRYEGFDREADALSGTRQTITQLEEQITNNDREARIATASAANAKSDTEAQQLQSRAEALRVTNSQIAARIDQLNLQSRYLLQDQKKVGPNLKDVRLKLRKEWIPVWLHDPQSFRPGTKMPTFWRIDGRNNQDEGKTDEAEDQERKAIAAFLWQNGFDGRLPEQKTGDGANGKELFQTKGCMACHSIGEGDQQVGGTFAANLTRVGDKANFEYIAHWIYNPRERFAPYCPKEKRDLTREDYEKKGLPYVFDADHSKCPNDGAELQIQNMTVMPNFRLTEQEARDIATYLFSLGKGANYPEASYMDDPNLKEQGRALVKQYGCAGCHEIKGLEDEQRIGKELTTEGATPIERLDFAMLTQPAEYGSDPTGLYPKGKEWYNHKGFFDHKLNDPAVYDRGKEKEPKDRLRMPRPFLTPEWRNALVTFLRGSVGAEGANVPASLFYNPANRARDIQEGWWVVKKYNCMGCHNLQVGQKSVLSTLPLYQNEDWKSQLPPQLTSEGARVDPDWLLRFLLDPSLSGQSGVAEPGRSDKTVGPPPQRANQTQFPTTGNANNQSTGKAQAGQGAQGKNNQAAAPEQTGDKNNAQGGSGTTSSTASAGGPQFFRPQPGLDRNGIRPYLKARMPTFNFSPNELRTLVRFFMAISAQEEPYIKEKLEPMSDQERVLARSLFTSQGAPCLKCHITGDPEHDKTASAPNFLLASERLKPDWTFRWLLDPQQIAPGTAMPSELFKREGDRWVFNGPTPDAFKDYHRDHARLLVRYMFLMTPQEQRQLGTGSPPATSGQSPAPKETPAPPAANGQKVSRNTRAAPRRRNALAMNGRNGARARFVDKWRVLAAGAHRFSAERK
ncbi:MAG: c-type cytochrome [Pyrinomonadaceae bacterium]|nr:c-type cytochrome [Pyrinomonadaceae bacterium]